MNKAIILSSLLVVACTGGSESTTIDLGVETSAMNEDPAVTDLGYRITVTDARLAVADILFTTGGDEEPLTSRVWNWIVPSAYAHPGHFGGGEVAGELLGNHLLDWQAGGAPLGTARMLTGR